MLFDDAPAQFAFAFCLYSNVLSMYVFVVMC